MRLQGTIFGLLLAAAMGMTLVTPSSHTVVANTHGKLQTSLVETLQESPSETFDVMVKMKEQATLKNVNRYRSLHTRKAYIYRSLTEVALRTQGDLVKLLEKNGLNYRRFYIMNMVYVEGASRQLIAAIAERDDVEKVYGDPAMQMVPPTFNFMQTNEFKLTVGDNLSAVGADRVWNELGVTGKGIVVAGQDTGIDWTHPALKPHYRGLAEDGTVDHNYNWYDAVQKPITGGSSCGYASQEPCDDDQHGSHTLGTVVGDDGVGNQVGMAPGAKWIGCRNMDAGTGRPHTYMACFEFFLAPYPLNGNPLTDGNPDLAPNVINNSWGCPDSEKCQGDVLLGVLQRLKAAGIFVIVSAGNSGPACGTIEDTPAWHSDDTFSVGAYDHRRKTIASFSSRGPSAFDGGIGPDVVAPGVSIRSSVPGGGYEGGMWSGTSMAGPHVVGLAALMWSANPKLVGHIDDTIKMIRETADPIPSADCMSDGKAVVPNNTYGYGLINAYKAVQAAEAYQ